LSRIPVLSGLLGLENGPFPRAGNPGTLNCTNALSREGEGFEVISGPSWRFVIDFSDVDGAQMVIPAGQSGNPMDEHFFDFYPLWASGNYWNVPLSEAAVMANKTGILEIIPGNLP
jgi:penicillin amidase